MVEFAHPEFRPDPAMDRERMEALQRSVVETAVFEDDLGFDPDAVWCGTAGPGDLGRTLPEAEDPPLVAGVDQAFLDDRAVSVVVALRGDEVVERAAAVTDLEIPYVPGLLAFREGGPILAAIEELAVDPDIWLFDGSGRIHFREAGLATHVGAMLDAPAVGVAKSLLCGRPRESVDGGLPEGERVAIVADDAVETAPTGTVIGYAVQTRQYDSASRHVNPLYVSPGHRVSAETTADLVLRCAAGYKLPEPTRLADRYADEYKRDLS